MAAHILSQILSKDARQGRDRRAVAEEHRGCCVGTDLLKPAVLLNQRRKNTGAAAWRSVHIVITEAAEEGAEDAAAPLLLQADVALGCWEEKQSTAWPTVILRENSNVQPPQSPDMWRPTQDQKTRGARKFL